MLVNNKLTKPGDIRRIDLHPDTVRITIRSGQDRLYKLVSVVGDGQTQKAIEVNHKGSWCPVKTDLFCQEGYCSGCAVSR